MAKESNGYIRVDLHGALEGHHVLIDPEEVTIGLNEDLQSDRTAVSLDALALAIKDGDLPKGCDRAGLRRLKFPEQVVSLLEGVGTLFAIPKS